eukprot:GFYU01007917.1.p1 GENE.GFYU01007917.1~~GFYU01007917.1.p1  ORF type:complete len:627 (+),score=133.44 GFYU01007917.1:180-2060(+)
MADNEETRLPDISKGATPPMSSRSTLPSHRSTSTNGSLGRKRTRSNVGSTNRSQTQIFEQPTTAKSNKSNKSNKSAATVKSLVDDIAPGATVKSDMSKVKERAKKFTFQEQDHYENEEKRRLAMERRREKLFAVESEIRKKMTQRIRSGRGELQQIWRVFLPETKEKLVTLGRFSGGLKKLGFELNKKDVSTLFAKYDTNKDGFIDFEEFIENLYPNNHYIPKAEDISLPAEIATDHPDYNPQMESARLQERRFVEGVHDSFMEKLAGKTPGKTHQQYRMFSAIDKSKNSAVSVTEFLDVAREMGTEAHADDLRRIFEIYDVEKKGSLDFKTFAQEVIDQPYLKIWQRHQNAMEDNAEYDCDAVEDEMNHFEQVERTQERLVASLLRHGNSLSKPHRSAFEKFARAIDGKVTEDEFLRQSQGLGVDEESTKDIFRRIDADKDGLISTDDFRAFFDNLEGSGLNARSQTVRKPTVPEADYNPAYAARRLIQGNKRKQTLFKVQQRLNQKFSGLKTSKKFELATKHARRPMTLADFSDLCKTSGVLLSNKDIIEVFKEVDLDKDGLLSFDDFVQGILENECSIKGINTSNKDADAMQTRAEARLAAALEAERQTVTLTSDTISDGGVD